MITAFLPCRKGSERIPNKNTKIFAGNKLGLLGIKIEQLINSNFIDEILLSTDDEIILNYVSLLDNSKITIDKRPSEFAKNTTTTDQLIEYATNIINGDFVVWTHVTSPFITSKDYDDYIRIFFEKMKDGYDSLMTVQKIRGFIWDETGPLNYDANKQAWPFSQDIKPIYEIDSGAFISSISNYKKYKNRIGKNPYLLTQSKIKSIDIDWPEDFKLAEKIFLNEKKGRLDK